MSPERARLEQLPTYSRERSTVAAADFNLVRLALVRLEGTLRFSLPDLRGLDFILTNDTWVCVDRTLNDVPVVAWVDFVIVGRSDLMAPVPCERRSYHAHAGTILDTLLRDMRAELKRRLADSN